MLRFKGLIFDKDGTLFHFQESWGSWLDEVLNDICEKSISKKRQLSKILGFNFSKKKFFEDSPFIAGTTEEFLASIESFSDNLKGKELEEFINSKLMQIVQKPVGDLKVLFEYLKSKKILLGVATNDNEIPCKSQLEKERIIKYFDFIAGSDSGYGFKPEIGQLEAFCRSLNLKPSEVAMIGDSTHDLIAAKKAGLYAIGVLTGVAKRSELELYADKILKSIKDLPVFLNL